MDAKAPTTIEKPRAINHKGAQPLNHIENLAFCGGGGRGLGYLPAVQEAQRYGLKLENIRHTAGTSAGAIAALLCSLTNDVNDIKEILLNMPASKLKDYSFSNMFFFNKEMGLCDGNAIKTWVKEIITKYTRLNNPTFEEFYKKTGKDLHVFATNLTQGKLVEYCVNKTPYARVAEAVQVSAAIPIAFKPRKDHNGDLIVDGGLLKNYPLQTFDFYDAHGTRYANPATIGFICKERRERGTWNSSIEAKPAKNAREYIKRLIDTAVSHEAHTLTPDDKSRTVMIDCPDSVGLLTFNINNRQREELQTAAASGIDDFMGKYYPDHEAGFGHKPLLWSQAPIKVLPAGHQYDFDPRRPLIVSPMMN